MDQVTQVRAGENAGRSLSHDFIVGRVSTQALRRDGESWIAEVQMQQPNGHQAVALWIKDEDGRYIQSAATFL